MATEYIFYAIIVFCSILSHSLIYLYGYMKGYHQCSDEDIAIRAEIDNVYKQVKILAKLATKQLPPSIKPPTDSTNYSSNDYWWNKGEPPDFSSN